nr:hypothetical protein [Streptomyces sp. WAC04770]
MTAQRGYGQLESAAREHAWQYGHALRSAVQHGPAHTKGSRNDL